MAPLPPARVDPDLGEPLYLQVAMHIEGSIDRGVIGPGDRLEGEIGLAKSFGVSRATMRHAINTLVERGILMRQHGVGTQVAPHVAHQGSGIKSLYDELSASGRKPSTVLLKAETQPAPEVVAAALGLPAGTPTQYFERLRLADGEPFGIMRNWVLQDLIHVTRRQLTSKGLYELLRAAGYSIRLARQSIGAEAAGVEQAAALRVPVGSPLLTIYSTSYVDLGQPIEHARHDYLPTMYRFEIMNRER